ncbi:hypothetical protein FRX31_019005 [Thalictrum thalictroides]|uniref:Uncharacterized protein n=1 Tax=Thalictrum thalictroides TaxID=46969 RepID=A0A7J6W3N7_THATH|nr:hypothetical protein FRX31_019005 [Thalictrum thalictroides]
MLKLAPPPRSFTAEIGAERSCLLLLALLAMRNRVGIMGGLLRCVVKWKGNAEMLKLAPPPRSVTAEIGAERSCLLLVAMKIRVMGGLLRCVLKRYSTPFRVFQVDLDFKGNGLPFNFYISASLVDLNMGLHIILP